MYNSEEDEKTQKWMDEVLTFRGRFFIEKQVIQTMKSSRKFTMENFAANDNVLNEVLDDFNVLYYYSYLREELSIKEAAALQKCKN